MIRITILPILMCLVWFCLPAQAQFSPGELSHAHQEFDGVSNCTTCHESGAEISGAKCIDCHVEIKTRIETQSGYHYFTRNQTCMDCHTEHVGRTAKITNFDEDTFNHNLAGYALTGKHAEISCGSCHTAEHITEPDIIELLAKYPHKTFLGLEKTCTPCHEDHHKGTLGADCQSCHNTTAWLPAQTFDHSTTKFPLTGEHVAVECKSCHLGMEEGDRKESIVFKVDAFEDCTPCHDPPHRQKISRLECASCHVTDGFGLVDQASFDHNLTRYPLRGSHRKVSCEQCHKGNANTTFAAQYLKPFKQCTSCHRDEHRGEFRKTYRNDCLKCHTINNFTPSTFTLPRHQQTQFPLEGAHMATLCMDCHKKTPRSRWVFAFETNRCETCHADPHNGQFVAEMATQSCAACHNSDAWTTGDFNHDDTAFPLVGLHQQVTCEQCHIPVQVNGAVTVQYKGAATVCQECHVDSHMGQFVIDNQTMCASCHTPNGWPNLIFDHDTQSAFPLTGSHENVACELCHEEDRVDDIAFIRYKPVPTQCEACHKSAN